MATPNGIDCCNYQMVLIGVATTHLIGWDRKVAFNKLLHDQIIL